MDTITQLPLAGIQLQDPPGFWPLAIGWWLIIFSLIALLVLWLVFVRKVSFKLSLSPARKSPSARKEAIKKLNRMTAKDGVGEITELLRQAAMTYYPREKVAGLVEDQWLRFLDLGLPTEHRNFINLADYWMTANYSGTGVDEKVFTVCQSQALLWLEHALPPNKHSVNALIKGDKPEKNKQEDDDD